MNACSLTFSCGDCDAGTSCQTIDGERHRVSGRFHRRRRGEAGLGSQGYYLEGPIGACAPAPVCGAVPLYRYFRPTGGGDFIHTPQSSPPIAGYSPFGIACNVWTN